MAAGAGWDPHCRAAACVGGAVLVRRQRRGQGSHLLAVPGGAACGGGDGLRAYSSRRPTRQAALTHSDG